MLLLVIADQLGYGNWREIKQAIRRDSRARFDHLLLSRSEVDLQRRLDILIKALEKEEAPAKRPTFEEVAGQMQRALEELRLADAKAQAEAEEQRALKRSQPKVQAKKPVAKLALEKQGSTVVVEDRSAPKGDESMVPGEDDIQMIDVEDKRGRSLSSSVQIDDDDEGTPRGGNPEEERRRRLEQEANSLRIGYQRAMSDEDEEMEDAHSKKRRPKPSTKKTDDRLKQTKLAFTNLSGQKRQAEASISSLSDQEPDEQQQ